MDYIQWAIHALKSEGFEINSPTPLIIQNSPWANVSRLETHQGFVFLKKVPPKLSLELTIIKLLSEEFDAHVPHVIAYNHDEHCFLMYDAGISLNEYFKTHFYPDVLIDASQANTDLQMKIYNKISLFLDYGVSDWRLDKLPILYHDLVVDEKTLIDDGITPEELKKLRTLTPKLQSICEKLSRYHIKDTFGHSDFHDKNILVDPKTHKTTIIDLGEVSITHPFFSLLNCLHMARERFKLSDEVYYEIENASLQPWLAFETHENTLKILSLIGQCWTIHAVLGELRLLNSVDPVLSQELRKQGRLAKKLRIWINQYN